MKQMPSACSRRCQITSRPDGVFVRIRCYAEVVSDDGQVLGLASSGTLTVNQPGKVDATRKGGFADVDMWFDGTTFTILGKNVNMYAQISAPGSIDQLVDLLRDKYGRALPAAELTLSNAYDALMENVVIVKDLGSGVIGGVE